MAESMKDRLIRKFEGEIHALDRELKLELPKEIKRARELGDLRENAEYSAAKERQRLVESRISMPKKRVAESRPINFDRVPTRRAGFGSTLPVVESNGGKRLWDDKGFWRAPAVRSLYRWRTALQLTAWTLALAVAIVAVPIAAVALGAIVFPIDFLARMMGADGASGLVDSYLNLAQS